MRFICYLLLVASLATAGCRKQANSPVAAGAGTAGGKPQPQPPATETYEVGRIAFEYPVGATVEDMSTFGVERVVLFETNRAQAVIDITFFAGDASAATAFAPMGMSQLLTDSTKKGASKPMAVERRFMDSTIEGVKMVRNADGHASEVFDVRVAGGSMAVMVQHPNTNAAEVDALCDVVLTSLKATRQPGD
jgi:hypothetical protein